jgi:hypothetical protein
LLACACILILLMCIFILQGTYYGNKEGGLCQLNVPNLPSVAYAVDALVALNKPQMFGSSACGICLRVCRYLKNNVE